MGTKTGSIPNETICCSISEHKLTQDDAQPLTHILSRRYAHMAAKNNKSNRPSNYVIFTLMAIADGEMKITIFRSDSKIWFSEQLYNV